MEGSNLMFTGIFKRLIYSGAACMSCQNRRLL